MFSTQHSKRKIYSDSAMALVLIGGIILLAATGVESKPISIGDLLGGVVTKVVDGVYAAGEMDLLGHPCQYSRTPYFKRFELHYRASVRCPGWTPIVGKAEDHLSPSGAENAATRDFVRQAVDAGLVTEEEAKAWL